MGTTKDAFRQSIDLNRESVQKRMTLQQGPVGILTTDINLIIQVWDAALTRFTGIDAARAIGKSLTEVVPGLEQRRLLTRFDHVLNDGVVEVLAPAFHHYLIPCPPLVTSKRFTHMQQRVTIAPLRENEKIAGVIVTVEDVTERLERESELARQLTDSDEIVRLEAAKTFAADETLEPSAQLLGVLKDESWRVRKVAVDGLVQRAAPDAIAALLNSVRENHHNLSLINSALQVLALTDVDTLTPLIEFLKEKDPDLRMQAILALGEQRDGRAIPALIGVLDDPDMNVRYHAIEALGKLHAAEAVPHLLEVTETRDFFLAFPALDALSEIGDSSVASDLVPLLKEESLCEPTAAALGRIGDEDTVAPLADLLNSRSCPARVIAQALGSLYDKYERLYHEGSYIADLASRAIKPTGAQNLLDALNEPGDEDLRARALVLGWLQGPAITRALTHLLGRADVRSEVIESLVRQGPRVTQLLIEQLKTEDLETRKAAVVALGRIGERVATPALIEIVQQGGELVIPAADALAKIGDARAFEVLLGLIGDPSAAVRQAVVGALNSLGAPQMAERIIPLLSDPDPNVRESAIKIAGYFGYPQCVELLFDLSRDPDERVRRAAIEHLPYLEDKRVLSVLAEALRDETPKVRAAAAGAMGQVESAEGAELLRRALKDKDPWVRYFAARSLGRQRSSEAIDDLAHLASNDAFNHVRIAAIDALGRIGGEQVIELASSFTKVEDADVVRAAVGALAAIGNEEALMPLVQALRSPHADIRKDAVDGLGKRSEPDVTAHLLRVAASDPEPMVFEAAMEMLRKRATPETVAGLISLLPDELRREAAIAALSQLGPGETELVARGLNHQLLEVRKATVEVLSRMKDSNSVEFLPIALRDRDASVRSAAKAALRRSYQPLGLIK